MTCVGHSFTVGEIDSGEGSGGYRRQGKVLKKTGSQSSPELLKQGSDKDLASNPQEVRNWRGIGIAICVIFIICALIVTSVFILSPGQFPDKSGNRLTLDDVASGRLQVRKFNGTWLSDTELVYLDGQDQLILFNVANGSRALLVSNIIYRGHNVQDYSISHDRKYILLKCGATQNPFHGPLAVYKVMDSRNHHVHPLLRSPDGVLPKLQHAQWGPQGSQLIYIDRYSIYFMPEYGQRPIPLVTQTLESIYNAIPDYTYRARILKRDNALWWSQDGTKLCYATFDITEVNRSSFIWYGGDIDLQDSGEFTPSTPVVLSYSYAKPGTPLPQVSLYVIDLINIDYAHEQITPPREIMFREHYLTGVVWVDNDQLVATWMMRSQNHSIISLCQGRKKWSCQKHLDESTTTPGWVEPFEAPLFTGDGQYYFLLMSIPGGKREGGNFRHVTMVSVNRISRQDGKPPSYLTYGHYEVTSILAYNKERRVVYYSATVKGRPGQRHIYSADDTSGVQSSSRRTICLTCILNSDCSYYSAVFSPGCRYYVLTCEGPRVPRVEIRRTLDDELVTVLDNNDHLIEFLGNRAVPLVKIIPIPLLSGFEGRAKLFFPANPFEESHKYPVLVHVCEHPATQCVSEAFSLPYSAQLAKKRNYIYLQLDGRGSRCYGDKLEHEIYRQLGIPETNDYIQALRHLRQELPYIDADRIAIWGQGYGGHVAASVLADDETIFNCALAIAPITSWKHYDAAFTEKFMASPNPDDNYAGYENTDLSRKSENLRGKKLIMIHGTADDNVHVYHTLMLAKQLVRSGVPFIQQLYPDEGHNLNNVQDHMLKLIDGFLTQQCFKHEQAEKSPRGKVIKKQSG